MSEKTDGNDDVPFERQPFLCFEILILELCAAAEGNDFVFVDHEFERCFMKSGVIPVIRCKYNQYSCSQMKIGLTMCDFMTSGKYDQIMS
jgi:hypothetical protein